MTARTSPLRVRLVVVAWCVLVGLGYAAFTRYTLDPGAVAPAPRWPEELPRASAERARAVVFFVHPECECTPASAAELARLLARAPAPLLVSVYTDAPIPPGARAAWIAALPAPLRRLPGARFLPDPRGALSTRFGATTSGEVHVYGAGPDARFRGGVTASRGHEGANEGADRVRALLADPRATAPSTPVFGCGLREDAA